MSGYEQMVARASIQDDQEEQVKRVISSTPAVATILPRHRAPVNAITLGPHASQVLTASDDRLLHLYSVTSGETIVTFAGHKAPVLDVAILPSDRMVSVGEDSTVRLWKMSDGSLLHSLSVRAVPFAVAPESEDRFFVGLREDYIRLFQLDSEKSRDEIVAKPLKSFCRTWGSPTGNISVRNGKITVGNLNGGTVVWGTGSGQRISRLRWSNRKADRADIHFISLGERLIASASPGGILLYDGESYMPYREISTHSEPVSCVHLVGDDSCVLSSSVDMTIAVHDTESGELLWRANTDELVSRCLALADGRVVVGTKSGAVLVVSPPATIRSKLLISPSSEVETASTVLQDALISVLSEDKVPAEHCGTLILRENCCVSLEEWHSAHQLLVLAVRDGDIEGSTTHKGKICWWFDQLYVNVKEFDITSQEDETLVKGCLLQAKKLGLIEGVEAAIGALRVMQDVKTEVRVLRRAGMFMFERILSTENRLECLKESYERYRKAGRCSSIVGVVAQLIPLIGASLAGAVSAGAEFLGELSVADITETVLGLDLRAHDISEETWDDRLRKRVAVALRKARGSRMCGEDRTRLEEAVSFCGLTMDKLVEIVSVEDLGEEVEDFVEVVENEGDEKESRTVEDQSVLTLLAYSEKVCSGSASDVPNRSPSISEIMNQDFVLPSAFSRLPRSATYVSSLNSSGLAALWAAFSVRFRDESVDCFMSLRDSLEDVLCESDVHGDLFVDASAMPTDEVVAYGIQALEGAEGVRATAGLKGKLRQFVQIVREGR